MAPRPQAYRIQWPLTPTQVEAIDTMFETLFKTVRNGSIAVSEQQINGTVLVPRGGTGITGYAIGDILYASAADTLSALGAAATGNALISGGLPSWGKIGLTTHVSGILPVANGGTGFATYAVGDLLYASATGALSKLADVATGNALISGGVNTAPSWGKVALTTHVSGTLPIANGGTGQTTASAAFDALSPLTTRGDIIYRNATTNTRLAAGTSGQFLQTKGSVLDPVFAAVPSTQFPMLAGDALGLNPANATTYFFGLQPGFDPGTTSSVRAVVASATCTMRFVEIGIVVAGVVDTANNLVTFNVRITRPNGVTLDVGSGTISFQNATQFVNFTLSDAIGAGDSIQIRFTTPTFTTLPTLVFFTGSIYADAP